jgi:hypothetical protein
MLALGCCIASSGCSNTHGPSEIELPSDFSYVYHMSAGSVGPPFWYSLDVSADAASGACEATIANPDPVDPQSLTVSFEANDDSLLVVLRQMIDSRIFRPSWDPVDCPCGGAVRRLEVRARGVTRNVPPPGPPWCVSDQGSLDEVCDSIWLSVPVVIRDSLMSARESWIIEWDGWE